MVRHNRTGADAILAGFHLQGAEHAHCARNGVASDPDFALAWDSAVAPRQPWWPEVWAKDHTMRTALPPPCAITCRFRAAAND
jgi:hypothetical protein